MRRHESGMSADRHGGTDVEFSFGEVLSRLWLERWITGFCVVLLVLVVAVSIWLSTPRYAATLTVAPAQGSLIERPGSQSGLSGFAGLLGASGQEVTPFEIYVKLYRSPDLAEALERDHHVMRTIFAKRWDAEAGRWKPSFGPRNALRWIFGVPSANVPDLDDLRAFLSANIDITPGDGNEVQTVSFLYPDRSFARNLLQWVHDEAEILAKQRVQVSTRNNVQYLTQKVATITQTDQRQALIALLAQQENVLMLSQSWNAYAGELVQKPSVSMDPVSPNPTQLLLLAIVGGFFLGCIVIFLRLLGRRQVSNFASFRQFLANFWRRRTA